MSLSGRLLVSLLAVILIGEALIYFPSIATYRLTFLKERLVTAQIAASGASPLATQILGDAGITSVVVHRDEGREIMLGSDTEEVDAVFDLREATLFDLMFDAASAIVQQTPRRILVKDHPRSTGAYVEAVMDESTLRRGLRAYSWRILSVSLILSAIAGGVSFLALNWTLVRPIRRLTQSMTVFREQPYDAGRTIVPSGRVDEIGSAERALAELQDRLRSVLSQQARLAGLGAAVSKISHDLRNILATAQLVGDRLRVIDDPTVQRLSPTLIQAIDRALSLCQRVLRYGKADEAAPRPRQTLLSPLVEEVGVHLGLPGDGSVRFINEVPEGLLIVADPEQLFRVLVNLGRNAVQAIEQSRPRRSGPDQVRIAAEVTADGTIIRISDSGPGLSSQAIEHLFEPFLGSDRPGGAGLGLAIARELMVAHGGSIALDETAEGRTVFRLTLPGRIVSQAVA